MSQESGEKCLLVCAYIETFEFGINEDDYICDQLIDRCYLSHLCWKFLEKKGTVMLDDLL